MVVKKRILGKSWRSHDEELHGRERGGAGGFHKREAGKKAQGVEETGKEGKATAGMDLCSTGEF